MSLSLFCQKADCPGLFQVLPGNSATDRLIGAVADLSPPIKARVVEIHPLTWSGAICMRVEVYGCPAGIAKAFISLL